ncbi:MAG: hypothetical protein ACLFQU_04760 [Candidatus Kapaibacterium sp.]
MSDKFQGMGPENETLAESLARAFRKEREKNAIDKMVSDKVSATDFGKSDGRNFLLWPLMIVIVFGIFSLTTYTVYKFAAESETSSESEIIKTENNAPDEINDPDANEAMPETLAEHNDKPDMTKNNPDTREEASTAGRGSTKAVNKANEDIIENKAYETKVSTKVDVSKYKASELDIALATVMKTIGLEYSEEMKNGTKSFVSKQKTGVMPSNKTAIDFNIIFSYDTHDPGDLIISLIYRKSDYTGDLSKLPDVESIFYSALKDSLSKAL